MPRYVYIKTLILIANAEDDWEAAEVGQIILIFIHILTISRSVELRQRDSTRRQSSE